MNDIALPASQPTGKIMSNQTKQIALPLGISVASVVAAFLGGALWINAQLTAMTLSIHELSRTVAALDASRFTAANGLEMWQAISDIKTRIAVMEARSNKP